MSLPELLNNRYKLEERLGSGGMAVVYRARDLMLERQVAIKILRQDFSQTPAFRERFHQEAKAAANLSHPNIVTVHDFGISDGFPFIVMEYVSGTDLHTMLQRRGRFTVEETLNLMVQACAGLGFAHRAGLVHCDVKPHNMLVAAGQRLKVSDFGIARAVASVRTAERPQFVWGSPQYFSPEQAAGKAPTPAADVYSLGVLMFQMLTGQLPFQSDAPTELARLHQWAAPPLPRQINPEIPQALEDVILKVLSKEPAARYRTADQLGHVLLSILRPQAPVEPPRKPIDTYVPVYPSSQQPIELQATVNHSEPKAVLSEREASADVVELDWITLGLGLLAILAVGGLIPFWIWAYFR